jgi:5-formyltetrahydrofolate cyclo-ligase
VDLRHSIAEQKRVLRASVRAMRTDFRSRFPDAEKAVSRHFPTETLPRVVAGTWPIEGELDMRPLMRRLSELGVGLALPRTPGRGGLLSFRAWDFGQPLEPGPFGTMHPAAKAPLAVPDLVLVPLLAFDARGARLGAGGGFYDRTLASLSAQRIGVAYAAQEVSSIPTEPHDVLLDAVVTEMGFRRFSNAEHSSDFAVGHTLQRR